MHAGMAVKLDATCAKVDVFFVLFAAYAAKQSGQHGLVQLLVACRLVVHRPALLVHHGQELRMHVAPFAPAPYVDEVLSQQVFMLTVTEFMGRASWAWRPIALGLLSLLGLHLWRFASTSTLVVNRCALAAARRFQPIPQAQIAAEFTFFVLELGVRLVGLRLCCQGAVAYVLHAERRGNDQHLS